MSRIARALRTFLHGGSDAARAMRKESETVGEYVAAKARSPLAEAQAALGRDASAVRLGRFAETGDDFHVAGTDLLRHALVIGENGVGKSVHELRVLLHLWWSAGVPVVLIDPKGEMVALLKERLLPTLLASADPEEARRRAREIRLIDPFGRDALPPMNVLVRDPSMPLDLQAFDTASCFETAVDAGTGVRMETINDWAMRLLLSIDPVAHGQSTFLTLRRALEEPAVLEALVRLSTDRDTVSYFLSRYPSEPQASRLALLARLDRFLALPNTRLCLSAPAMVGFDDCLNSGLTMIDLGNAPAGATEIATFWATIVFTRLMRAIYRRSSTGGGTPAVIVIDEWQSTLTHPMADSVEDLLARARSRGVFLHLLNQQLAQVDKVSSSLRDIVLGQTSLQVLFRASIDDARTMRHLLPTTGTVRRPAAAPWEPPAKSAFLSAVEELDARLDGVVRLPDRHAYFWDRRKPWPAVLFRTATVDLSATTDLADDLRAAIEVGTLAVPIVDLEQSLESERRRLDALARYGAPTTPSATPGRSGGRRGGGGGGSASGLPW